MQRSPGMVFFEPADTGFNATAIAPATLVSGVRLGWGFLGISLYAYTLSFTVTGGLSAAHEVALDYLDVDGVTVLRNVTIWTAITAGAGTTVLGRLSENAATAINGALNANNGSSSLSWPFVRFAVRNTDAVNASNVTLRVALSGFTYR